MSTCCNIETLAFVSLRVSKFRFLGCIFGGPVLCIYYANEFSFLPLFLSCFVLFYLIFYRFSILFLFFYCFVLLLLIRAICPIVFCAYCQPGRGGVTFDSLVNVPRYHVIELPYYLRFGVLRFGVLKTCHIVLRSKICHVICALCPFGGVVLSYFAVEDFAVVGVHSQHHTGDTGSRPLTLLS